MYQGSITFTKSSKLVNKSDIVEDEENQLAPGLYNESGELTMTWSELLNIGAITVNNGSADAGYDYMSLSNPNNDVLVGHLVLADDVTTLSSYSFGGLTKLTEITFPTNFADAGMYVFDASTISKANYNGTVEQWNELSKDFPQYWNCNLSQIYCSDGIVTIY